MNLLSSPPKSPRHMEIQSAADSNMASSPLKSPRRLLGLRPTVDSPMISTLLKAPDRAPIRSSMARVLLLGCLLVITSNILLQVQESASFNNNTSKFRDSDILLHVPEPASSSKSTKTKLEELRLRRAALADKKNEGAATADLQPTVDKLQRQLQELTDTLRTKEQEAAHAQQQLSQAEQDVHEARKFRDSDIRLQVPKPASSNKNKSKLKRNQVELQVLPERVISVFGLESSGTLFLAETLATAIAAKRIKKDDDLHLHKRLCCRIAAHFRATGRFRGP